MYQSKTCSHHDGSRLAVQSPRSSQGKGSISTHTYMPTLKAKLPRQTKPKLRLVFVRLFGQGRQESQTSFSFFFPFFFSFLAKINKSQYFILYLASYGPDSASAAAQDTRRKKELLKYTIFKFKFYTVNDKDSKYSSWIEANGRKRYCFGPNLEGGGQNPGCSLGLDGNDPAPHNP